VASSPPSHDVCLLASLTRLTHQVGNSLAVCVTSFSKFDRGIQPRHPLGAAVARSPNARSAGERWRRRGVAPIPLVSLSITPLSLSSFSCSGKGAVSAHG
jgi:hypothetical protein